MKRFATRVVHAGLEPDPSYGGVVPAIHQASTYKQPSPGEFVEDYDYARSANPTRAALESAIGELDNLRTATCGKSGRLCREVIGGCGLGVVLHRDPSF